METRQKRTYVKPGESEAPGTRPQQVAAGAVNEGQAAAVDADVSAEHKRQEAAQKQLAAKEATKTRKEASEQETAEVTEQSSQDAAAEIAAEATAEATAKATAKATEPQDADAEGKDEAAVSTRKDKRDRHDLDDEDPQQKKSKHGTRKRRVQELADEDLLDVALVDASLEDAEEIEAAAEAASEAASEADAKAKASAPPEAVTSPLGLSSPRAKRRPKPVKQHKFNVPTREITRVVELGESITIQQLSRKMSVKAHDVIKTLGHLGVDADTQESLDQDTAVLIVEELGHKVKLLDMDAVEKSLEDELVYEAEASPRPPVVTVMGHVDHGKTSLLDYIRKTGVASGESGGITQHIGAYKVATEQGEICFIDTPGHAAFTAMRARGASSTDIVILVVAADDGVMPQTEEAIQHARGANVPLVVAVNKIDKEGADPERVRNELAAREVVPDDWGGDTQFIQVSATTGEGVDALLDAIQLQAELLELTAVEQGPAKGVVIESELDKGRGAIATLLVQNGALQQGDIIVAGQQFGRVRALHDENGNKVTAAGPATPVAALGLNGTPNAGDGFIVTRDERRAREVADYRRGRATAARFSADASAARTSLDNLLESFDTDETKLLKVVLKADVRGSLEAITFALNELGNDEVKVNIVMSGVGGIAESDATYAVTANAVVFGFNVRADNAARKIVEAENLDLRYYNVIYNLVDDVKAALSGMLSPEVREEIVGNAEVRDLFESKKMGMIAGCIVLQGTVSRQKKIRVLRDNVVIYEGELESLRRFKDEVENVAAGTECGIGVKHYNDVKVGDQIEVFDTMEVAREL